MGNLSGIIRPGEPLPERPLSELIDPAPSAGAGLHNWAFYAANAARVYGFTARDAAAFIVEAMMKAGRPQRQAQRETRHAVSKAFGLMGAGIANGPPSPPPPAADAELMAATAREGMGLVDLWEASPGRFDEPQAAEIYRSLMGPDLSTLVCIAREHVSQARTLPLGDALPLVARQAFTCQSPMSALTGPRLEDGKPGPRTLANCGPRRWAVLEFDPDPKKAEWAQFREPLEAMAAFLWSLNELTQGGLAVATHSGGKSLHGWFHVAAQAPADVAKLFAAAAKFGADMATRCPAQMVRIPDGHRANGTRQTCYYFNPNLPKP